jgi:hypothetical protein
MTGVRRLTLIVAVAACGGAPDTQATRDTPDVAELWQAPSNLESRDLFYGPGGRALAPDSNGRFTLVKHKEKGTNLGYDVVDDRGREWSVKLGKEARVEVAISRVIWAVGYHQPSIYYVRRWTVTDSGKNNVEQQARFRLEGDVLKKKSDWSWGDNPFLGTQEFAGLVALMVLFNNWDLKTVQNVVYEVGKDSAPPRRRYVVKDLGGALGWSGWLLHTKDDANGFDKEPFITGVHDGLVTFAFRQNWPDSLRQDVVVKPADLRWICGLLQRLSEKQWRAAFRAGGFREAEAERYIRRLKKKIADGLAIAA